jgi:hypothetical protein
MLGAGYNEGLVLLTSYEAYDVSNDDSDLRKQIYKGDW